MSDSGKRLIEGAQEALAIAKGEKPAAAIWHNGHRYLSEAALSQAPVAEPVAWTSGADLKILRDHWPMVMVIGASAEKTPKHDTPLYARAALQGEVGE